MTIHSPLMLKLLPQTNEEEIKLPLFRNAGLQKSPDRCTRMSRVGYSRRLHWSTRPCWFALPPDIHLDPLRRAFREKHLYIRISSNCRSLRKILRSHMPNHNSRTRFSQCHASWLSAEKCSLRRTILKRKVFLWDIGMRRSFVNVFIDSETRSCHERERKKNERTLDTYLLYSIQLAVRPTPTDMQLSACTDWNKQVSATSESARNES